MEDFDAKKAKEIVSSMDKYELHNILVDIKRKAEDGETALYIKKSLKNRTIEALKDKGFSVVDNFALNQ